MYKQLKNLDGTIDATMIKRIKDGAFIPFDNANTDFMQFKHDLSQGVELQDANGVVMTADQIKAFEATLP